MSEEEQARAQIRSFLYVIHVCRLFGSAIGLRACMRSMHAAGKLRLARSAGMSEEEQIRQVQVWHLFIGMRRHACLQFKPRHWGAVLIQPAVLLVRLAFSPCTCSCSVLYFYRPEPFCCEDACYMSSADEGADV